MRPGAGSVSHARFAGIRRGADGVPGLAALLLVLAVSACSMVPPRIEQFPVLAPADRSAAFETVWESIRERYYDPTYHGVDWNAMHERYAQRARLARDDASFWHTLQRMTAELRDAHTRVHDPRQALDRQREEGIGIGLTLAFVGEQVAVATVEPDSTAARLGVRPGDLVTGIDGLPLDASWQQWRAEMGESSTERSSRWRWLRGRIAGVAGTTVALTLASSHDHGKASDAGSEADAGVRTVILPRMRISTALKVKAERLPSGVGHVAFNRFRPPLAEELREAIAGLGPVGGLIVDLRGNGGGSMSEVRAVLEDFVPARTRYAMSYTRATGPRGAGRSTDWTRSVQRPPPDVGPLAVLVDGRTASGAELLAAALQEHLGAQLVGSSTCGCVLGIRQYQPLPGGAELAVSEIGFYSAHGRRIEGSGLDPDVVAEPTLEDLRQGLDPALTAAERLLGATSAGLRAAAPPLPATSPTMETPR